MKTDSVYLRLAEKIADRILDHAISDQQGLLWETWTVGEGRKFSLNINPTLYNGSAGIALFLLELYRQNGKASYLESSEKAMARSLTIENEMSPAFYTGNLGVAYVYKRFFEETGAENYRSLSLEFTKKAIAQFSSFPIDDLINGKAGSIIALLHLYKWSEESWMLEPIKDLLFQLISNAQIKGNGLYWDRSHSNICGLCGLSHGASGIASAFIEAGRVLKEPALYSISKLAFQHEKYFFLEDSHNWADLRKGSFTQDEIDQSVAAIKTGNREYLRTPGDMNAWCHGAAGIGMSRLHALNVIDSAQLKKDLNEALIRVKTDDLNSSLPYESFNLCHGTGGNLDLLIQANSTENLEPTAERIEAQLEKFGMLFNGYGMVENNEPSLFIGDAGVGYYLLRANDSETTKTIMLPQVPKVNEHSAFGFSQADILMPIVTKAFPLSITKVATAKLDKFLIGVQLEHLFEQLVDFMKEQLSGDAHALELLRIEHEALALESQNKSEVEIFYEHQVKVQEWREIKDKGPEGKEIELINGKLVVSSSKYEPENPAEEPDEHAVLLLKKPYGTKIHNISDLSYFVLKQFESPSIYEDALKSFFDEVEAESEEEHRNYSSLFREQVITALDNSVLVIN